MSALGGKRTLRALGAYGHKPHRPIWFVLEITGLTKVIADPVYRIPQFKCELDSLRIASLR